MEKKQKKKNNNNLLDESLFTKSNEWSSQLGLFMNELLKARKSCHFINCSVTIIVLGNEIGIRV